MVAAAVVPFSSVGPGHAVDRDTQTTFAERMGFDDTDGIAAIGEKKSSKSVDDVDAAPAPLTPKAFKAAVEAGGGVVSDAKWPTSVVVVPAVYDEWDPAEGSEDVSSGIPEWATPSKKDSYSMAPLYQRRFDSEPNFVPNKAYETGAFIKFVVDHYDDLPEVTAFVSGDFADVIGSSDAAKQALGDIAEAVEKGSTDTSAQLGRKIVKDSKSTSPHSQIAGYQPLIVDPDNFLQSRSPGELVQMWKQHRWGWEDIMGDSAGAAAAHLSRCWRSVAEDFGVDTGDDAEADTEVDTKTSKKVSKKSVHESASLGQFFFSSSSKKSQVASQGVAEPVTMAISKDDKKELQKTPISVSLYPGAHFAMTKEQLLKTPLKTWEKSYDMFVTKGVCFEDKNDDEIRDKFDLGVSLEFLSHVIFGGQELDAGQDARCCGDVCVFEDASCSELGDFEKTDGADAYDVASVGGPRFDADEARMLRVESIISRYNGWNLKELREERASTGAEDTVEVGEEEEEEEEEEEVDDEAEDLDTVDSDDSAEDVDIASLGSSEIYWPQDWKTGKQAPLSKAKNVWQGLLNAESRKVASVGDLGKKEKAQAQSEAQPEQEVEEIYAEQVDDFGFSPEEDSEEIYPDEESEVYPESNDVSDEDSPEIETLHKSELREIIKEFSDQSDAQLAEIQNLKAEVESLRKHPQYDAIIDDEIVGGDEKSAELASALNQMDKATLASLAKEKIDAEEAANEKLQESNRKLKDAMKAMEESHHEERTVSERRVEEVKAQKAQAEQERVDAMNAVTEIQREVEKRASEFEQEKAQVERALEADEKKVTHLRAKLQQQQAVEQKELEDMEAKKNVAAEAARNLRKRLADQEKSAKDSKEDAKKASAKQSTAASPEKSAKVAERKAARVGERTSKQSQKPIAAKVGAAEDGSAVASLALPPRRHTQPVAEETQ